MVCTNLIWCETIVTSYFRFVPKCANIVRMYQAVSNDCCFYLGRLSKVRSSLEVARAHAIDHDGLSTLEN